MSKTEILDELPRLSLQDLAEVQAKLDELAGQTWLANSGLSEADKSTLEASIVDYQKTPDVGSSWEEVRARLQARLRQ